MTGWQTIRDRSFQTMLEDERKIRESLEGEYRRALALLERLARTHYGVLLEEHRRAVVTGTDHWSVSDWDAFFRKAALSQGWQKPAPASWHSGNGGNGNGHNGNGHKVAELEREISRLRAQVAHLKQAAQETTEPSQKKTAQDKQKPKQPRKERPHKAAKTPPAPDKAHVPHPTLDGYRPPLTPLKYSSFEGEFGEPIWRRGLMILYLIAVHGINAHVEIDMHIARKEGLSFRSNSTRKPVPKLERAGWVVTETIKIDRGEKGGFSLKLLRLTDEGRKFCKALGWQIVESEWERLLRLHQGDRMKHHTLAVLYFAALARVRGWDVTVMPDVQAGKTPPDVLIVRGDERHLVEVELGNRDETGKWQNLQSAQGHAAICTLDEAGRKRLANDCKLAHIPGFATDLESLKAVRIYETTPEHPLWMEEWQS